MSDRLIYLSTKYLEDDTPCEGCGSIRRRVQLHLLNWYVYIPGDCDYYLLFCYDCGAFLAIDGLRGREKEVWELLRKEEEYSEVAHEREQ